MKKFWMSAVVSIFLIVCGIGVGGNENGASSVMAFWRENPVYLSACAGQPFSYSLGEFTYSVPNLNFRVSGAPKWVGIRGDEISGTAPASPSVERFLVSAAPSVEFNDVQSVQVELSIISCTRSDELRWQVPVGQSFSFSLNPLLSVQGNFFLISHVSNVFLSSDGVLTGSGLSGPMHLAVKVVNGSDTQSFRILLDPDHA